MPAAAAAGAAADSGKPVPGVSADNGVISRRILGGRFGAAALWLGIGLALGMTMATAWVALQAPFAGSIARNEPQFPPGLLENSALALSGDLQRPPALGTHPRVAIVGFVGREGSTWFLDVLQATQSVSNDSKVCVVGFEPVDHPKNKTISRGVLTVVRREFYFSVIHPRTQSPEEFQKWVTSLNAILAKGTFPPLKMDQRCAYNSAAFMFKTRIHQHFSISNTKDAVFLAEFSRRFRDSDGLFIILKRHNMILRAFTGNSAQFDLKEARTDEQKEAALARSAGVHMEPADVVAAIEVYQRQTSALVTMALTFRLEMSTLYYEDLLDNFDAEITRLFLILGLALDFRPQQLSNTSEFTKVSPTRMCQKIANYKQVCEYMADMPYSVLFDDRCDTLCI